MFQRIVLAYDGSKASGVALTQATDIGSKYGAELNLIGIVSSIPSTALTDPYPQDDFIFAGRSRIERALLTQAEKLRTRGLEVNTEVLEGSPANEIAKYAKKIGADLVVIGHADKGYIARWFEGSTGAKLVRDLPCSLLIATAN